jgi:hypothetical protein
MKNLTNAFELAENDLVWVISITAEQIADLLAAPVSFVKKEMEKINQPVVFGPEAVTIEFQYAPFTEENQYIVHGISYTNLISVRCPPINMENNSLAPFTIKNTQVTARYLVEPFLAFAHFDPTDENGLSFDNMAYILANPATLPEWLNLQSGTLTPVSMVSGEPSTPLPVYNQISFLLSDQVHFSYETNFPLGLPTADPPIIVQCTKVSGIYTPQGNSNTILLQIDEVRQALWTPEPSQKGK